MKTEEKQLDALSGAVILNQLALDFNEALVHTAFYKHKLKSTLKTTIKELIKAEAQEFDKVFEIESEYTSKISENVTNIMRELSKGGFVDLVTVGNIILAHKKNPKAIEGIVKKILS